MCQDDLQLGVFASNLVHVHGPSVVEGDAAAERRRHMRDNGQSVTLAVCVHLPALLAERVNALVDRPELHAIRSESLMAPL